MILADQQPTAYASAAAMQDSTDAFLRMARLYYDRYSWVLDWSNTQGKTALHIAALKGNEELVRVCSSAVSCFPLTSIFSSSHQMLCDLGADFDLSDNKGNTPLH